MTTPQLGIPELEAAQSQPEVIVNKALRMLEAALQLTVIDKDLTTPPGAADANARYIVPATGATGAWLNQGKKVAFLLGSVWAFLTPQEGWKAWVQDEGTYYIYEGGVWVIYGAGGGSSQKVIQLSASDLVTDLTTATGVAYFRSPYAMTLDEVRASLIDASSSGVVTVDININGSTILSTKLTVDATEKTSVTAATPAVISSSVINDDDLIAIDIDGAGTDARGLIVTLIGS